ncbi:MAG: ZIP family metal transporter [Casimicrobium sp.]
MLLWIVLACAFGGVASVLVAAFFVTRFRAESLGRLIAFAAGAMLAAALLNVLPEAIELSNNRIEPIMWTLLIGLVGFYLLERAAIWRHSHDTEFSDANGSNALHATPWVILIGDGLHNFVDGVLIAAAFLADPWLGVTTALAVAAHELPQELGDMVLLLNAGWSKRKALLANALSGSMAIAGGALGYFALSNMQSALPYALAIAAASFIYIAVADLLPHLHRRHRVDGFLMQSGLLAAGLACIAVVGELLHHH